MDIIAFINQKGGGGKSTLAVHTAVAAEQAGRRVIILDRDDKQGSSSSWGEARQSDTPPVITLAASELSKAIKAAEAQGFDTLIIDGPPHSSPDVTEIARHASVVIVPVKPSAFDLRPVRAAAKMCKAAKKPPHFVLTMCIPGVRETEEARQVLAEYGTVADVEVHNRISYVRALNGGQSVTEFERTGKAAGEIRELWHWIEGLL